ncbi:MAG: hypothetical protein H8E27_04375 [Verrucomicrobia subdivision 3 bacterium]|nr:hypothetical protein [Limisphaerales bacterium]
MKTLKQFVCAFLIAQCFGCKSPIASHQPLNVKSVPELNIPDRGGFVSNEQFLRATIREILSFRSMVHPDNNSGSNLFYLEWSVKWSEMLVSITKKELEAFKKEEERKERQQLREKYPHLFKQSGKISEE